MNLKLWFTNPGLALGMYSFSSKRLDTFETLAESLGDKGKAAPVTLRETFRKWANRDRQRMEPRYLVFANVEGRLGQGGTSFAQALRPFIPNDEYLILASGEIEGNIHQSLTLVIRNILATEDMKNSVRTAMAQPVLGVLTIFGMSLFFGMALWPIFMRSIPLRHWPQWTLPCIEAQMWFAHNWWMFGSVIGLAVLYYTTLPRWTGRLRDLFDKLPPWSIYKGRQASSLLGVLSALIASGRTVRESFVLVRDLSTPYMRWHMERIIRRYDASGEDAMSSLRTGLFSRPIMDRIEDAAGNRTFGATLQHIGNTSLKVIARLVNVQANVANGVFLSIVATVFVYITLVTVFGVQDAIDSYLKEMGGAGMMK